METLEKRIADWVASPEGKMILEDIAKQSRRRMEDVQKEKQEFAKWWAENKDIPMTI
jgi:hypothetical protein